MLHPHRALLAVAVLAGVPVAFLPAAARAADFTKIVDSSALPNNASIGNVSTDGSAIAFAAGNAIYFVAGAGGTPVKIADLTTPSPTGGGAFTTVGAPLVSGNTVVFQAAVKNNQTQNSGLYVSQGGGALSVIVDTNTADPQNPTARLNGAPNFDFDGTNVVFTAVSTAFPFPPNVYRTTVTGGAPTALLPFQPNTPAGLAFGQLNNIRLQGDTYVVGGQDSSFKYGLYSGNLGGGPLRTVVDAGTAEPSGQGNFAFSVTQFALSSDGATVVFVDGVAGKGVTGLYSAPASGGGVSVVAQVGAARPGGGTFGGGFNGVHIEGTGGVDFADSTSTIFATGLSGGGITRVLGPGDLLDGQRIELNGVVVSATGPRFGFAVLYADAGRYAAYLGNFNSQGVTHPAFFGGEVALGNGAYYLTFPGNGNLFGYYSYLSDPRYIYHFDLGYEYIFDANDGKGGVYFYDFASQTFFYSSPGFPFPYLYDFSLNTVLYYYPDTTSAGHYTTNPRYFFNTKTGQIITK